jgi:hypothetical protein
MKLQRNFYKNYNIVKNKVWAWFYENDHYHHPLSISKIEDTGNCARISKGSRAREAVGEVEQLICL